MSEWRSGPGSQTPAAWLSLDKDDNDITRFLIYLATALGTLATGIGETGLANLKSSQPPPMQVILTALINDLVAALSTSFVLVLDDYHLISSQAVHEAVTFLLDHLPPQMHLVILTRADPNLPLSSLRARNQMTELRAADLRFTFEEATNFMNQVMGLVLSKSQVEALEGRTEGWVAGLQLAALSMQGREDVQSFISALSGSHRYILDYLAEEVLNRQPAAVREFVLRTSILDRLTAPLCNVLTSREDGQEALEDMERANLFLIPLDDERRWYRYHHLFADMLSSQLNSKHPDMVHELHHRAAIWYEQNQFAELAVEHTFMAHDYRGVEQLFRKYYYQQLLPMKSAPIFRWFEIIPKDFLQQNPWLCIAYAWLLWTQGNRDTVGIYLDYAKQEIERQISVDSSTRDDFEVASLTAEILAFQGLISTTKGDFEQATLLANQALNIAPDTSYAVRSEAYLDLYLVYRERGMFDQAIDACNQSLSASINGRLNNKIVDAFNNLGLLYIILGQLNEAEKVYREGLQYFENERQANYPGCRFLYIWLAEINYEWNRLDKAESMAIRALELSEQASWWLMLYSRLFLARLQHARGNMSGALKLLAESEALLQQLQGTSFEYELKAHLARFQAECGKSEEAAQWVQSVVLDIRERLSIQQYIMAFLLAHTLNALGRVDELLNLLSQIEATVTSQGYFYWQIELSVLKAVAWLKKGNPSHALTCLEHALLLAEGEGYVRIFLDEGEPIVKLLQQAATKGIHPDYARKLLSTAFPAGKKAQFVQPLIEPLSERELEVLRLVAEGKSNQQISNTLFIARGTVKKHINNIFGKLGVQTRTQCVARGRELNLL